MAIVKVYRVRSLVRGFRLLAAVWVGHLISAALPGRICRRLGRWLV